jgi:hypothetical protein
MGMLFTAAMYSRRTTGNQVTLFPVFQAFMAVSGFTFIQEIGFALAAFLGCHAYGIRTGTGTGRNYSDSIRFALVSVFAVRAVACIIQPIREEVLAGYPQASIALVGAIILLVLINSAARVLAEAGSPADFLRELTPTVKSVIYPLVVAVMMVPAVIVNGSLAGPEWPWTIPACTLAVIALQSIISLLLDRARFTHTRSLFLENEISGHTRILASMETPMDALRKLASFWYGSASPVALRVTWGNTSIICPTLGGLPREEPLTLQGEAGLVMDIWPTPMTPMDSERLDIFITQTETVLTNLELRQRVSREGWQCLEAMVSSLDITDLRRAGYSKRVAEIARRIGRRMGLQVGSLDDLEMAAMLHLTSFMLEKAEEDWQTTFSSNPAQVHFELPPEVLSGIRHVTENFDGTGLPEGLRAEEIPQISRILAVACSFATGKESHSEPLALQEIHNRSGSIYDPAVVEVLEGLIMDDRDIRDAVPRRYAGSRHPE